ncbi:hypothetical protein LTS18_000606, partial [Coniosporium uncinatum]
MPLKFSDICDLLSSIEAVEVRDPPLLRDERQKRIRAALDSWFRYHRRAIDAPDTNGVALLSTLFPEQRTDRVYALQQTRLSKLIARSLCLNSSKTKDLQGWRTPGKGDLATCVENVLRASNAEPKPGPPVTIDEVDSALHKLASQCRFSSAHCRSSGTAAPSAGPMVQSADDILGRLFLRFHSREAKWMVRLILKDFAPVILDLEDTLHRIHFLLPGLLRFQNTFQAAYMLLRGPLKHYHSEPDAASQRLLLEQAAKVLSPAIGVK